jgi:hypothetical protein
VYKVTVNFAHGVSHQVSDCTNEQLDMITNWLNGATEQFITFETTKSHIVLNRDYVCSVVVEEV